MHGEATEPDLKAVVVRIIGRVQGVGFRAFTNRQAKSLGLTGWVRNRDDGSVEVQLEGVQERVDDALKMLQQGPALARVDKIVVTPVNVEGRYEAFDVVF